MKAAIRHDIIATAAVVTGWMTMTTMMTTMMRRWWTYHVPERPGSTGSRFSGSSSSSRTCLGTPSTDHLRRLDHRTLWLLTGVGYPLPIGAHLSASVHHGAHDAVLVSLHFLHRGVVWTPPRYPPGSPVLSPRSSISDPDCRGPRPETHGTRTLSPRRVAERRAAVGSLARIGRDRR